jgi:hypothetical protein
LPTLTASLRVAALVAGAVLALPLLVAAQSRADLTQHYGDAIGEVYRTSNHLTVTAYFDDRGLVCREHIESESRGRRMTDKEVNAVLDEIAPKSERGNFKGGMFLNLRCLPDDDCAGVSEDYERLAVTKIGSTNEYRYVSILYHTADCKKLDAGKEE